MTADRQLGLLWAAVVLAAVALLPLAPRLAEGVAACPVKTISGLPCPTCGTTRAVLELARGELLAALALNPLVMLAALVGGAAGLVAGARALAGRPLWSLPQELPVWVRFAIVAAVAVNWGYLLWAGV